MRFGRKQKNTAANSATPEPMETTASDQPARPAVGPFDAADIDLDGDHGLIDLGGMLLPPPPDPCELQLQVDEQSGEVMAVVILGEDGGLELRPFAASRNADLWGPSLQEIAAETSKMGGTVEQREGEFGSELVCVVPVQLPDGQEASQASRIFAVAGPRWLLRATIMGRPAVEPQTGDPWEDIVRATVVNRGTAAMPPGDAIPLTLPPEAQLQQLSPEEQQAEGESGDGAGHA